MAIGDSKEDLSAYSREDLVYKAKLAEQAERYVTTDDDAMRAPGITRARKPLNARNPQVLT